MSIVQTLLVAWVMRLLLPKRWSWLALVLAPLALLPIFHGIAATTALRALWGDPSMTTLQLVVLTLVGRPPAAFNDWRAPAIIALAGAIFYPLALGFGNLDPYRFGFQPVYLVVLTMLPALLLWWRQQPLWLWLLTIDLAAFVLHVLESSNFWDYLLDPLLAFGCLLLAIRNLISGAKKPGSVDNADFG